MLYHTWYSQFYGGACLRLFTVLQFGNSLENINIVGAVVGTS